MNSDKIQLQVGTELVYRALEPTALLLVLKVQPNEEQFLQSESLALAPELATQRKVDLFGNAVHRLRLPLGETVVRYDAVLKVSAAPESVDLTIPLPDLAVLPWQLLRYTLPSRYCDSDKLLEFAAKRFGSYPRTLALVQAISDWVYFNIEYRYGACDPSRSASEAIGKRHGVCRDFAHIGIALCRAMNIPARYASGFLPDIGVEENPAPMDFHAYMEVYAEGRWHPFDPRHNVPRIGRVRVAAGLDAVEAAFATTFGQASLERFEVWAKRL